MPGSASAAELRVPAGFEAAPGAPAEPYTRTGWAAEIAHALTGMRMVYIPAGSFVMGSSFSECGNSNETPHRVTLSRGFYLGKCELTQAQWKAVMGANPAYFTTAGPDAPVESVSWRDCMEFCRRFNSQLNPEGLPEKPCLRLPTEAEWEYACRAGTTTRNHYGGDLMDASMANFNGNRPTGTAVRGEYRLTTVRAGSFKPNAWGLHDMHGNVHEWCMDWFAPYPDGDAVDPQGPSEGTKRVFRGGSWFSWAPRSAAREAAEPHCRYSNVGFRPALSIP